VPRNARRGSCAGKLDRAGVFEVGCALPRARPYANHRRARSARNRPLWIAATGCGSLRLGYALTAPTMAESKRMEADRQRGDPGY
jgi:hypothetical protein